MIVEATGGIGCDGEGSRRGDVGSALDLVVVDGSDSGFEESGVERGLTS